MDTGSEENILYTSTACMPRSESDSVPGSSEMVFRQEKGMLTVAKK